MDTLVVGAGFAGATAAERLASHGHRVVLIDRREHIGGNAYDKFDDHGVLIHPYGPHIFHTNDRRLFEYLSRFTDWRFYEHRVRAWVAGQTYPLPINRTTINGIFGLKMTTDQEVEDWLAQHRAPPREIKNSEDALVTSIGEFLTDTFFRGYSRKQWGRDLSELSPTVAARVPVRTSEDDRYFTDQFQFMPLEGYTKMFERMVQHKNILVEPGTEFDDLRSRSWRHVVFTGPIDEFFNYRLGRLPYRSLSFSHQHKSDFYGLEQTDAVYNYPSLSVPFTRVTEFRHLTGQEHTGTSLCYEYPQEHGAPYYPVPTQESQELYRQYEQLDHPGVTFVGRLAQYRYYNMDQAAAAAIVAVKKIAG